MIRHFILPCLVLLCGLVSPSFLSAQAYQNFINPLFIPDTISTFPVGTHSTIDLYMEMDSVALFANASPSNPLYPGDTFTPVDTLPIETMTYKGMGITNPGILAPTLIWYKGDSVTMSVHNNLMDTSTTHWHGAHVAPYNDGGPHQVIPPMTVWSPSFTIRDEAATQWYHPHLHHHTMMQVEMGMAGIIIIKDPADTTAPLLPHDYGVNDFPIIIQDKLIEYNSISGDPYIDYSCGMGTSMLVNGTWKPELNVPSTGLVRFRVLNGSSDRSYCLSLQIGPDSTNLLPFDVIASDKGYLETPYRMNTAPVTTGNMDSLLIIMPGERYEIVFDVTGHVGDSLFLVSRRDWMSGNSWIESFSGGPSHNNPICYGTAPNGGKGPYLSFDSVPMPLLKILPVATPSPITSLPATLTEWDIPAHSSVDVTRQKRVDVNIVTPSPPVIEYMIDSAYFDMEVLNDTICLGNTEVWKVENFSGAAHPFHIHDVHFFITNIEYTDTSGIVTPGTVPPYMQGPKDVMPLRARFLFPVPLGPKYFSVTMEFIAEFPTFGYLSTSSPVTDYAYMYHCHMLSHEDEGMMHQFFVRNDCVIAVDPGVEELDWELYPNPATGTLWMKGESFVTGRLRMVDSKGEVVREWGVEPFAGVREIELGDIPAGMYMVSWACGGKESVKRVAVVR